MTCEILEDLAQEGLLDSKVVEAAVVNEKLQDVLRAENMVMQERLNLVLMRLGLAVIPCSAGGGDDQECAAGGAEADDEDELALIAELAAMRAADGGGARPCPRGGRGAEAPLRPRRHLAARRRGRRAGPQDFCPSPLLPFDASRLRAKSSC